MRALGYGLLLIITILTLGCGGDGGHEGFTGIWEGNFQSVTGPSTAFVTEAGSATIVVSDNGNVTGTAVNTRTGETFDITGTLLNTGSANLTFTSPLQTFTRIGTLQRTLNHITGTIGTRSAEPGTGTVSFDLSLRTEDVVDP